MSRNELVKRLKMAGLDISIAELAEIEAGKHFLNYYQVTVFASILNTTAHQILC